MTLKELIVNELAEATLAAMEARESESYKVTMRTLRESEMRVNKARIALNKFIELEVSAQ